MQTRPVECDLVHIQDYGRETYARADVRGKRTAVLPLEFAIDQKWHVCEPGVMHPGSSGDRVNPVLQKSNFGFRRKPIRELISARDPKPRSWVELHFRARRHGTKKLFH